MSKIAALISVLMLALAGSAFAQDYRSPDAKPVVVTQDFTSPDAKPVSARSFVAPVDRRSPDATPSGRFQAAPATTAPHGSDSFDWAYLAILVTIPLLLIAGYFVTLRRGRHGVAVGS